jgi:hypothetical protein
VLCKAAGITSFVTAGRSASIIPPARSSLRLTDKTGVTCMAASY